MSRDTIRILLFFAYVVFGFAMVFGGLEFYQNWSRPNEATSLSKSKKFICVQMAKVQENIYCRVFKGEMSFGYCLLDAKPNDIKNILPDIVQECARVKGEIGRLNTVCGDSCIEFSESKCRSGITVSCNCGPNRCWAHGTCIENPKWYKKKDEFPYSLLTCNED